MVSSASMVHFERRPSGDLNALLEMFSFQFTTVGLLLLEILAACCFTNSFICPALRNRVVLINLKCPSSSLEEFENRLNLY